MKILVLGSYYSSNLGDGVICECVASRLRKHFPGAQIQIMDLRARDHFDPGAQPSIQELRQREGRKKLRKIAAKLGWDKIYSSECYRMEKEKEHFRRLREQACDMVVFAGGQMFMDTYALQIESVVKSCAARNIPVFFNACGFGPSDSPTIRQRLKNVLAEPCVKLISTRDDAGKIQRNFLGEGREAVVTFDPALWTNEVYGLERNSDSSAVGLGMMYPNRMNFQAVCRFWIRLIGELERRQISWKIFVNGSGSDVSFARYVFSRIPGISKPFEDCFVSPAVEPRELVETISGFKSLISFRLHSHILAASLGIPSVAMVWDDKVRFFFEKLGCAERCCGVQDAPGTVLAKLERAEKEGVPAAAVEQQRCFADSLLREAIIKEQERMTL